jgi:hypothetical protein
MPVFAKHKRARRAIVKDTGTRREALSERRVAAVADIAAIAG